LRRLNLSKRAKQLAQALHQYESVGEL
jgi:hypothetical protein